MLVPVRGGGQSELAPAGRAKKSHHFSSLARAYAGWQKAFQRWHFLGIQSRPLIVAAGAFRESETHMSHEMMEQSEGQLR
jgi:hypothetical protein